MQTTSYSKVNTQSLKITPVSVIQIVTLHVITLTNSKADIISKYWMLELVSHKTI